MKWAYQVRYKIRTASFLTAILVVILVANLFTKQGFSNLDKSLTSLVNDRLKPATYIFELSSYMYQKRLLHQEADMRGPAELKALMRKYDDSTAALVRDYEVTYLTKDEQKEWFAFRTHLSEYNAMEILWLQRHSQNELEDLALRQKIDYHFNLAMQNLNRLSSIQIGEAGNIQKETKSIIHNNVMMSYLEISLLIILGLFTLVLLTTTDQAIFKQQQNQNLN